MRYLKPLNFTGVTSEVSQVLRFFESEQNVQKDDSNYLDFIKIQGEQFQMWSSKCAPKYTFLKNRFTPILQFLTAQGGNCSKLSAKNSNTSHKKHPSNT